MKQLLLVKQPTHLREQTSLLYVWPSDVRPHDGAENLSKPHSDPHVLLAGIIQIEMVETEVANGKAFPYCPFFPFITMRIVAETLYEGHEHV